MQVGTEEELNAKLSYYAIHGVTVDNQNGFEWYPPAAVRKIVVKF